MSGRSRGQRILAMPSPALMACLAACTWGCSSAGGGHSVLDDAGLADATFLEAGPVDAAPDDAGSIETGAGDAGPNDGGSPSLTCLPSGTFDPTNPASSGYALAFSDDFTNSATIDLAGTGKPGFNWYVTRFDSASGSSATFSLTDGGLVIAPTSSTANYNLGSAGPAAGAQGYVGQVFGGGGYFEATLKFDPSTVVNTKGFPAFWGESVEHFANKGADDPPGTDGGFEHFAEDDFFEFDTSSSTIYSTAIIDWYGVYTGTCEVGQRAGKTGYCNIVNNGTGCAYNNYKSSFPDGGTIDWTQWHTVGQLWVPGNAADGHLGYVQNFIDGVTAAAGTGTFSPLSKTGWDDSASYTFATLPHSPAVFSILDQTHLVVILGSGPETPISVSSVKVWQIPGCAH